MIDIQDVLKTWFMMREMAIRTVECMPEDKLDFTPSPNCRPFKAIATHVLQSSYFIANTIVGSGEPRTFTPEQFTSKAELAAALRESQGYVMQHVAKVTPERLKEAAARTPGGVEMPITQWVMILLVHEADHRGNLAVLAKAGGASPPDIGEVRQELLSKK